jgi:hypothetical protein
MNHRSYFVRRHEKFNAPTYEVVRRNDDGTETVFAVAATEAQARGYLADLYRDEGLEPPPPTKGNKRGS